MRQPTTPPPPFPLYLLPSLPFPFRRRRSSTSTNTTPTSSPSNSPPQPTSYLTRTPTTHLRCHKCLADLAPTSAIISKGFTGRHGRAYLVSSSPSSADLPNTNLHKAVPRQLVTGAHTVSDISCALCGCVLGWKYVGAEEESQKYKVGKFILETRRVVRGVGWEEGAWAGGGNEGGRDAIGVGMREGEEEVEFDSQDEEECEDLFSGIWTPQLARRRRRERGFAGEEE